MKLFRISTIPLSLNILLKGQLKYLSSFYDVTAISGAGEDLSQVGHREEVKIHPIEIERNISLFKDVVSLIRLYLYFRREKPDIIHSITPKAGLLSMIAGKLAGVPVRMHTFTGLIFPYRPAPLSWILIAMDKLLCSCATHVYPEGQGVRKQLLDFSITSKPLKVLANGNVNGIDAAYYSRMAVSPQRKANMRAKHGIPADAFVLLFVGRVVKDKGINELIAAFTQSQFSRKTYLVLVGSLEAKSHKLLPHTFAQIHSNKFILPVGFQDDVRPFYSLSDAFVFPSYREGFPNVVLQAGAMELPSIVTDIPGCNEIIRNEENGLIIPPKNTAELAIAMRRIVDDPALRQHLTLTMREDIEEKYNQRGVWLALKEEYEQVEKRTDILSAKN